MNWLDAILPIVLTAITSIVIEYIRRPPKKKIASETTLDITEAASKVAEGGEKAVEAMKDVLAHYETIMSEQKAEIASQKAEVASLRASILAMQIDERAKEATLHMKIEAQNEYIKIIVDILRERNIDIPPRPDILKDSNPRIKAVK